MPRTTLHRTCAEVLGASVALMALWGPAMEPLLDLDAGERLPGVRTFLGRSELPGPLDHTDGL